MLVFRLCNNISLGYMEYNPFKVVSKIHKISFLTRFKHTFISAEFFNEYDCSISYYEFDDTKHIDPEEDDMWKFEVYFSDEEFIENILGRLKIYFNDQNIEFSELEYNELENIDWVKSVHENLPDYKIGDFLICSPEKETSNAKKYKIKIAAARAFGTGGHETTSMCIKAIQDISKKNKIENALDVGTGSGILGIAIRLINKYSNVFASDIDKDAVIIAKQNSIINKTKINALVGIGYKNKVILENKPYKLICANILAKPLVSMALDAAKHLADGGFIILSGFLEKQSNWVKKSYEIAGLKLIKKYVENQWVCLVMVK